MREPNLIDTYQGDNQNTFPCKKVLHLSNLYLENDAVFIYSNYFSLNIILLSSPSLSLSISLFSYHREMYLMHMLIIFRLIWVIGEMKLS